MTPNSDKFKKKKLNMEKMRKYIPESDKLNQELPFVLGICGGDCAGKKELIQYMFEFKNGEWKMRDSDEKVNIIHQDYFLHDKANKFMSEGTNWQLFEKTLLHILAGNQQTIKNAKLKVGNDIMIKPAKLIIVEGSHIFNKSLPIYNYINSKIFVDSDSDVRLSRRIFKDTQDDGLDLDESIANYLQKIKPSYQKEIEPCKSESDIIIPHFGGGYNDHRKQKKVNYSTNIHNARALILAHIREEMTVHHQKQIQ